MDRIRKALELSRGQHAQGSRPVPATPIGLAGVRQEPAPARARTRSIAVNKETLRRSRVVLPGAEDAAAHAYKMLRTQVLQFLRRHGFASLAVVSPATDDGRTLTAINLALAVADDLDHTALLVDMDLRQPSVHRHFGMEPERGVGDCLRRTAEIADVLLRPEPYPKLVLLPAVTAEPQSSELLSGDSARQLTTEVRERYPNRIVIYDLPPLLTTADAMAFLPCVEAALLVVCEGRTRREDVSRCAELLRGTPLVGTVLNGSRDAHAAYA